MKTFRGVHTVHLDHHCAVYTDTLEAQQPEYWILEDPCTQLALLAFLRRWQAMLPFGVWGWVEGG